MQSKKIITFDFDGTIANSEPILFEVMNSLSSKFGFRKISKDEILDLKKNSIPKLMKKFEVSYIKLPFIVASARKMFQKRISEVKPVKGMPEVMKELKNRGYKVIIVTTNKQRTVEDFLKNNQISYIDKIIAGGNLFGKSGKLEKIIKKEHVKGKSVFYVGDEIRDIQAAKKAGLGTISVVWGFNSADALTRHNPDHLIAKPSEMLSILH